jgi:mRNA-degrading endonuclease RelE of RelBE toxin-antitoxin system
MTDPSTIEIRISPEFERNLRYLAKKYRSVKADLLPVIQKLKRVILSAIRLKRRVLLF